MSRKSIFIIVCTLIIGFTINFMIGLCACRAAYERGYQAGLSQASSSNNN